MNIKPHSACAQQEKTRNQWIVCMILNFLQKLKKIRLYNVGFFGPQWARLLFGVEEVLGGRTAFSLLKKCKKAVRPYCSTQTEAVKLVNLGHTVFSNFLQLCFLICMENQMLIIYHITTVLIWSNQSYLSRGLFTASMDRKNIYSWQEAI